jgi:hypothetical protein
MSQTKAQLVSGLSINASAPATAFNIDASGRCGIGTTPSTLLHIQSTDPAFRFKRSDAGTDAYGELTTDTSGLVTMKCDPANAAAGSGFRITVDNSEALRVDDSRRLLVGTSSARSNFYNTVATAQFQIEGTSSETAGFASIHVGSNSGGARIYLAKGRGGSIGSNTVVQNGDTLGQITFQGNDGTEFVEAATIEVAVDGTPGANDMPGRLVFSTTADGASSPTERMRINNGGATGFFNAGDTVWSASSTGAGTVQAIYVGSHSAAGVYGGTVSYKVFTNGNVQNTNGSYTTLSDAKLKENIVDAHSQWNDLKAIQIRNWNFKEETGHETHRQIGPIAQELETVCPGLVFEAPDLDEDGNETGEVTKGVNQSVLYMKAVKALQEAMERIEQLETEMAAVKAQLS